MSGNILNLIHLSFLALILLLYVFLCVHISIDIAYKMQFSVYFSIVLYGLTFYILQTELRGFFVSIFFDENINMQLLLKCHFFLV